MFGVGPLEVVVILIASLIFFGPDQIPEIGRQIGAFLRKFRGFSEDMKSQMREVTDQLDLEKDIKSIPEKNTDE
ncbi:MAG: twin-arginine translocase TatA/TatE family subunit [Oligoflexales bacterium]|nr:twin-arginine translocase TatA/TatE family subunit [Oligoflexales bacterium]